jgi:hypothetical protein
MAILPASLATREAQHHGTAALTWRASTSRVQLCAISGTHKGLKGLFAEGLRTHKEDTMSRLALLSTAVSLSLLATPVLAQTFSDYNGNDSVATREQGNTAAVGNVGNPNYGGGWSNGGIPIVGPLFGAVTSPVTMATGGGWVQSGPACGLYHDFNGRYTSVCGL